MTHDPEREAAAFLAGELQAGAARLFSEHLLGCEACWHEVRTAQRGRALVEAARTVSPAGLRERVRALVVAEQRAVAPPVVARPVSRPGSRVALVVAAVATVVAVVLSAGPRDRTAPDPTAFAAAVADFRAHELPGRRLPATGAPDLSALALRPVGAGGGRYGDLAVDGFAYRDAAGRRLVVYLSEQPFPTAPGATRLQGPDGPWTARRGDVAILCARAPHALLIVGQDAVLVRTVAASLGVL